MQLFSYTGNPGKKKFISEEYAYTIYCIDNHFVCIFLVLLSSINHQLVLTKVLFIEYGRPQNRTVTGAIDLFFR